MTTWVLLRGLAREAGHWGRFPGLLRERLPAADIVLPMDLPGNGVLHLERSPTRIAAMVERCRAGLRSRAAPPPYRLVALSLGGMVALEWARSHPAEVAACILVNSSLAGASPPWHRLRPAAALRLATLLWPALDVRTRERKVLEITSNLPLDHAVHSQWTSCAVARPVSRVNVMRQLVAAARYRLPSRPAGVPLVLLASECDRLVSARCSRALASMWGLPLEVHPWAGHDLALDDPAWLAQRAAKVMPVIEPPPDCHTAVTGQPNTAGSPGARKP